MDVIEDLENQTNELRALGINVMDQFSLEQNVAAEVDEAVMKQNRKQKINILNREVKESKLEIMKIKSKENDLEQRLAGMRQRVTDPRKIFAIEKSIKENQEQLKTLTIRKNYIEKKLEAALEDQSVLDTVDLNLEDGEVVDEDEMEEEKCSRGIFRDKMIKEGKMTPFGTLLIPSVSSKGGSEKPLQNASISSSGKNSLTPGTSSTLTLSSENEYHPPKAKCENTLGKFEKYLQDQINKQKYHNTETSSKSRNSVRNSQYGVPKKNKANLREFNSDEIKDDKPGKLKKKNLLKSRILHPKRHWKEKNLGSITSEIESDLHKAAPKTLLSEKTAFVTSEDEEMLSGSEYVPSGDENVSEEEMETKKNCITSIKNNVPSKKRREENVKKSKRVIDDGYLENYIKRIQKWKKERLKEKHRKILSGEDFDSDSDEEFERFEGNYKIPLSIWNKLFKYQRVCVKWLWELHCQQCGGILGDEMGLGKTVMVISFLIGLSYSGLFDHNRGSKGLGPVLIVSPATVLQQWVKEFHQWWPPFRVAILHDSGGFRGKKSALIHNINEHDGILISSYRGIVDNLKVLLNYDWHYIILDEGHKIRNPEAQITVAVKRFQTPHKLILSGSPIQNGLKELWSLFDFIFPGKLGTLSVFLQQFAVPITQGGYANASKLQVQTAFKCATVLRDTISPYLLRRMKIDVKNHLSLPTKNEQVLFCGLSEEQRTLYRHYLDGNEVKSIINGRLQIFVGLINLRKICNHPDLHDGGPKHLVNEDLSDLQPNLQYGWFKRSGKMIVLHSILRLWKKQNHKVLLFTQSRQMLCILEKFLTEESYEYLKMDGGTSVGSRQSIIDKFNNTHSIFIFLLTTRVGGLGVNLTGADRVIIYDPDWNPSTDTQARERAWRIGQKRHVTIYRLLTAGTIEEKIYHRQIFKQFLTNRVLKDPKQQRFFKTNDLFELFTLNEGEQEKTESAAIFAGTGSEIIVKSKEKKSNRGTLVDKDKKNRDLKIKDTSCKKVIDNVYNSDVRKNSNDNCNSEQILNNEEIKTKTEDLSYENFDHVETESLNCGVYNKQQQQVTDLYNGASSKNECSKIRLENDEKAKGISQLQIKSFENDLEKKKNMMALAKLLSKKISKEKLELNDDQKNSRTSFKMEKLKKKKMKKSKDHKKGKKFEGERIENLIKKRKFKYSSDEKEEEELNKAQDDFVLQKLFKRSGVHTALSHDVILNADDPDYLLLETEAERVAKEALKQVRMSRSRCLQTRQRNGLSSDMINSLPRFGGKRSNLISTDSKGIKRKLDKNVSHKIFSGSEFVDDENEMPEDSSSTMSTSQRMHASSVEAGTSSGVLSSAQLLKRMRERNRTSTSLSHSSSEIVDPDDQLSLDSSVDSYDPRYPSTAIFNINSEIDPYMQENVDLLTDIRNFVSFQAAVDGQASTDEVVERFRDRVPNNQNHIFKALLKQICDFVRDSSGKGFWYLKEEFR